MYIVFKDLKGEEIDTDNSGKLVQLTKGLYEEIIDLYLDEDDLCDFCISRRKMQHRNLVKIKEVFEKGFGKNFAAFCSA